MDWNDWFSFWRTDQWTTNSALQYAPSDGVGGLHDYAHARVNQWPIGSPCLPTGQFVKN